MGQRQQRIKEHAIFLEIAQGSFEEVVDRKDGLTAISFNGNVTMKVREEKDEVM